MDPSQEKVAQRILGGFRAGDGDSRGKSGRQTRKMLCLGGITDGIFVLVFKTRFCRFMLSVQF